MKLLTGLIIILVTQLAFSATYNQNKTQHRLTMKSTSQSELGPKSNDAQTVCEYFIKHTDPNNCKCPNYDSYGGGSNCHTQGWWNQMRHGCAGIQVKCAVSKELAAVQMAEQNIQNKAVEEFKKLKGEVRATMKEGITDMKELMKEASKEQQTLEKKFEVIAAAVGEALKEMACSFVQDEIEGVNYLINMLNRNDKAQTKSVTLDKATNTQAKGPEFHVLKLKHKFEMTPIVLSEKLSKEMEGPEGEESFFEWSTSIGLTFESNLKVEQSLDMSSTIKVDNKCKNNQISFTAEYDYSIDFDFKLSFEAKGKVSFDESYPIVRPKFENFVFATPIGPIWLAVGGSLYVNIQGELNLQANLDIPVSKKFAKKFTLTFDNGKFAHVTKEEGTPVKVTFSLAGSVQAKLQIMLTPALDLIFMGMPAMLKFDFSLSGQGTAVGDISKQFGGKVPAFRQLTNAKFCGGQKAGIEAKLMISMCWLCIPSKPEPLKPKEMAEELPSQYLTAISGGYYHGTKTDLLHSMGKNLFEFFQKIVPESLYDYKLETTNGDKKSAFSFESITTFNLFSVKIPIWEHSMICGEGCSKEVKDLINERLEGFTYVKTKTKEGKTIDKCPDAKAGDTAVKEEVEESKGLTGSESKPFFGSWEPFTPKKKE